MGVDHPGIGMSDELLSEIRRSTRDALQNSSIGRNGIRFYDGGKALFQGGGGVEIQDTGYIMINGSLTGLGEFNWEGTFVQTGQSTFTGPTTFTGTINATGTTAWSGTMSILGNLQVLMGGQFICGPIVIDRSGPAGGRIRSTGQLILGDATGAVYIDGSTTIAGPLGVTGFTNLQGLDVSGPKNFKMEHPSKPGHWLRHGATESPVSGTEYTGRATIGADGTVTVTLPDYFEALNKPENRTAQVTPVGQPFLVGASDIEDGRLTIYGTAGRDVYWLVKAERIGGDFLLEEPIPDGQ